MKGKILVVREDGLVAGEIDLSKYPSLRLADQQADLENLVIDIEDLLRWSEQEV